MSAFDVRAFALEKAVMTRPYAATPGEEESTDDTILRAYRFLRFLEGGER